MRDVKTLLDLAKVRVKTDLELAKRLDVPRSRVSDWRHGRTAMTPDSAAAICDILELPADQARQWAAAMVVANAKPASKQKRMQRALFERITTPAAPAE